MRRGESITSTQFEEQYKNALNLKTKNYKFVEKANKADYHVGVSSYKELDYDYLYYCYANTIWELNLSKNLTGVSNFSLRKLLQGVLDGSIESHDIEKTKTKRGITHLKVSLTKYGNKVTPNFHFNSKILDKKEDDVDLQEAIKAAVGTEINIFSKENSINKNAIELDNLLNRMNNGNVNKENTVELFKTLFSYCKEQNWL